LRIRYRALAQLRKVDEEQFLNILLATLESLPPTPAVPYYRCPEAPYALLVEETEDERAWKTLEKVARSSDVGLRMEYINTICDYMPSGHKGERLLHFLAAFLDDAATPDLSVNPRMFAGYRGDHISQRLEVRDLAAMNLALMLRFSDRPDRNWTPQQWEDLRARVKARLEN
jgi:hypothetical protein